jgi:hypothetical protein
LTSWHPQALNNDLELLILGPTPPPACIHHAIFAGQHMCKQSRACQSLGHVTFGHRCLMDRAAGRDSHIWDGVCAAPKGAPARSLASRRSSRRSYGAHRRSTDRPAHRYQLLHLRARGNAREVPAAAIYDRSGKSGPCRKLVAPLSSMAERQSELTRFLPKCAGSPLHRLRYLSDGGLRFRVLS